MPKTIQITFDAHDPKALALFWLDVLDYSVDPPPGGSYGGVDETIAAWADFVDKAGVTDNNTQFAISDPTGAGPRLFFQKVDDPKASKNRVHIDVRSAQGLKGDERMDALEAEAVRLVEKGATRLQRFDPDAMEAGWIVMADPEGNEFCLD